MTEFNGVSIIPTVKWSAPDVIFSTDACLDVAGGWSDGEYFKTNFPEWLTNLNNVHINELEMMALIIGLKVWCSKFQNSNALVYCDNNVTVEVVNRGKAHNRFSQACLREICYITAKANAVIKVVHLEGSLNRICNSLSRWGKSDTAKDTFYSLTKGYKLTEIRIEEGLFQFSHDW